MSSIALNSFLSIAVLFSRRTVKRSKVQVIAATTMPTQGFAGRGARPVGEVLMVIIFFELNAFVSNNGDLDGRAFFSHFECSFDFREFEAVCQQ